MSLLLATTLAALLGADPEAPPDTSAEETPTLSVRGQVDWLTALRGFAPREESLPLAQLGAQLELRPGLKLEYGSQLQAVVRPRLSATLSERRAGGRWERLERTAGVDWGELYATWRPDDSLAVSYGLQNFQWGPAELASPSNRLFHETGFLRDPLYFVQGKHLVRVNASAGQEWSAVLLVEVAPNGEDAFTAGEDFEPQALLKLEYASDDGALYVGATGGAGATLGPWFGEYASLTLDNGLGFYVDASHARGSRAWYPRLSEEGQPAFAQARREEKRLRTFAVGGARYTFESGVDVRAEYVFQDAGYSEDELRLAALASRAATDDPTLQGPLLAPGLELLGRHLAYVSVRLPELPPRKRLTVQARYLQSLTDSSGAGFVSLLLEAGDAWVLFASALATHGPAHGELSRQVRAGLVLGAQRTW